MTQHWDPDRYSREVGFVAALGEPLLDLLAPLADERILDLGCGDGSLTEKLVRRGCSVVAVDSSPEQVAAAIGRGLDARVVDGHALAFEHEFDGVISNAALHWMKQPDRVIAGVAKALVPGGRFVAEMGGAGNVQRIVDGIAALLSVRGIDIDTVNPWYFPSPEDYRTRLEAHGFEIAAIDHFPRPTPLEVDISAWLEIFTQSFFHAFTSRERSTLLGELRERLRADLCDARGVWEVDYVRLRFLAVMQRPPA